MEGSIEAREVSRDRSEALFSEAQPEEARAFRHRLETKIKTQATETFLAEVGGIFSPSPA